MSKKESAAKRNTFNVEDERLMSLEVDEDTEAQKKRRKHQLKEKRGSSLIEEDLVSNDVVAFEICKKKSWSFQ